MSPRLPVLVATLVTLALAAPARAGGPGSELAFVLGAPGSERVSAAWLHAFRDAGGKLAEITSVPVRAQVLGMPFEQAMAAGSPLVIVPIDSAPALDPDSAARALRPFLSAGGTVWFLNAAVWTARDAVAEWVRKVVAATAPHTPLQPLPAESVIYRAFFFLEGSAAAALEGAALHGRWAILHAPAWPTPDADGFSRPRLQVVVNVVEYAFCGDYKDEQTHIDQLLRRRNWKVE